MCEFSEKFYEILFDHELLSNSKKVAIFVPSQKHEKLVGYDVYFSDGPKRVMYIQFKVPYEYDSNSKKYKFWLYKNKNKEFEQHNNLCCYNQSRRKMKAVYYAPLFTQYSELYKYLEEGNIKKHSKCFYPRPKHIINGPTKDTHFIEYDNRHAKMWCENPIDIDTCSLDAMLKTIVPMNKEEFEQEVKELNFNQRNCCFLFFE